MSNKISIIINSILFVVFDDCVAFEHKFSAFFTCIHCLCCCCLSVCLLNGLSAADQSFWFLRLDFLALKVNCTKADNPTNGINSVCWLTTIVSSRLSAQIGCFLLISILPAIWTFIDHIVYWSLIIAYWLYFRNRKS